MSEGTVVAKNNLVYGNVDNYWGTFSPSSTNNLSGPVQADAPGSNPRNATTVTFVDAAGDDFHLGATDTGARGQAADLSADAALPFSVDVDGGPRRAPWDIGADEAEALLQGHYRWRNDDGSETTATWAAAEDDPLTTIPRMAVRRVRFGVSNEGAVASGAIEYRLQAAQSGSCATATYTDVPVDYMGTWDWQVTDSSNFTDGDPTTNVAGGVTDEATTFVPGQMKDAGNYTLGGITLNVDQFTEIEFAVRATATAVAGANYCFRLYDARTTAPSTATPPTPRPRPTTPRSPSRITRRDRSPTSSRTSLRPRSPRSASGSPACSRSPSTPSASTSPRAEASRTGTSRPASSGRTRTATGRSTGPDPTRSSRAASRRRAVFSPSPRTSPRPRPGPTTSCARRSRTSSRTTPRPSRWARPTSTRWRRASSRRARSRAPPTPRTLPRRPRSSTRSAPRWRT